MQTGGHLSQRVASWLDWVSTLARYFFSVIYETGLTKEQVVGWLEKLVKSSPSTQAAVLSPTIIPQSLVKKLAEAMAAVDIDSGSFYQALIRSLNDPPPGFKWKVDDLGQHRLVKFSQEPVKEKALAKGKLYHNKAFVGVWWYTDNSKSSACVRLRNTLTRNNGAIFYKVKSGADVTEFFGGCISKESRASQVGSELHHWAELLKSEEGPRDYRLSACSLSSLANHETVKASDTITISGLFKSMKYNWEYNLPDLLNGRLRDPKLATAVKQFLKTYGR